MAWRFNEPYIPWCSHFNGFIESPFGPYRYSHLVMANSPGFSGGSHRLSTWVSVGWDPPIILRRIPVFACQKTTFWCGTFQFVVSPEYLLLQSNFLLLKTPNFIGWIEPFLRKSQFFPGESANFCWLNPQFCIFLLLNIPRRSSRLILPLFGLSLQTGGQNETYFSFRDTYIYIYHIIYNFTFLLYFSPNLDGSSTICCW
jgi:hypothetical protein